MNEQRFDYSNLPIVGELANIPIEPLNRLQHEATELIAKYAKAKDHINQAIRLKYADQLQRKREELGKDTGTVSVEDGDFTIAEDLPKKIDWDQEQLKRMAEQIAQAGDDVSEYIAVKYTVSEKSYEAWPQHIRQSFEAARTKGTGKSRISIKQKGA